MAISYGELHVIGSMTNKELGDEYQSQCATVKNWDSIDEDTEDTINAILMEMETRGLPHP